MTEREPGFYWIQLEPSEDWEPAMFTGEHWVLLGTAVHEDTPEEPAVVGKTIKVPDGPLTDEEVAELDLFGELRGAQLLGVAPAHPRAIELWEREILYGRETQPPGGVT